MTTSLKVTVGRQRRESIRDFLEQINPETGYLGD
jgi:hypothetical protein